MKVFYMFKKRAVIIIGLLAIATLSFVPLSANHNSNQTLNLHSIHQSADSASVNQTDTSTSTIPQNHITVVGDDTNASITQNTFSSSSSDSTQPSVNPSDSISPVATAPNPPPPSVKVISCQPCGIEKIHEFETNSVLCPMINCPVIYPTPPVPVPTPQPSCSPCGHMPPGEESSPYVCDLVCTD